MRFFELKPEFPGRANPCAQRNRLVRPWTRHGEHTLPASPLNTLLAQSRARVEHKLLRANRMRRILILFCALSTIPALQARHRPEFDREHDRIFRHSVIFGPQQGLPPGLAKRGGNLPPGLQKHIARRGQIPPGLQKRGGPRPIFLPLPLDHLR